MTFVVDERELANFALTIGAVATVLLVALLVSGTNHVDGVGVALLLVWALIAVGYEIHPSTTKLTDDPKEETAQAALAVGSLASVLAVFIGATSGGPWDVIALIVFLAGVLLAVGASLLGMRATAGANGGASA